jgi:EmrB/QacA subfamily drug resistance transporter
VTRAPAARAAPARHIFFVLAVLAALMSSIDSTIVAVALPQLTTSLDAPLLWTGWTLTAYQLVQVIMLPLAGKLSDSFGRKRIFLLCVGIFTVGSLLCGLAPSIWFLIGARAIQAVGGGGLLPSAIGVISDHYATRRAQARGLFSSVMPIGGVLGPNLGGFILEHWSWRDIFFINLPIGVIVLVAVSILLESEGPRKQQHFDLLGLAQYAGAIVLLLVAMTEAGHDPALWRSPLLWGAVVASVVLFVLFIRHIQRAPDPVMEYRLVFKPPFLAANVYNMVFGAAVFGFAAFIPTYAVKHFGMSPYLSGAVLTPRFVVMSLTALLASLWIIRTGYRAPMVAGSTLIACTMMLLAMGWTEVRLGPFVLGGFWLMASTLAISGVGMGLSGPSSNNAALDLAPERAASLTGVRGMFRLTGGVLCIAAIVLALTFFPDESQGLPVIFGILSIVMLLSAPLAFAVPDLARERWRREQQSRL